MAAYSAVATAASALGRGEIVAFPTESSFGLGVDCFNRDALALLFALKGRESGKPPPLLVSNLAMLDRVVFEIGYESGKIDDSHEALHRTEAASQRRNDLVQRVTTREYAVLYRRPRSIVVRIEAGDVLEFREKGRRERWLLPIDTAFKYAVHLHARAEAAQRKIKKKGP